MTTGRSAWNIGRRVAPPYKGAASVVLDLDDDLVAAVGLGDDLRRQGLHVIRAQQPQRHVRLDGDVEQRLVQLALNQLGGAPPGPDRLPDPAHRLAVEGVLAGRDTLLDEGNRSGEELREAAAQQRLMPVAVVRPRPLSHELSPPAQLLTWFSRRGSGRTENIPTPVGIGGSPHPSPARPVESDNSGTPPQRDTGAALRP